MTSIICQSLRGVVSLSKSKSKLKLSQRRERACELFARGYTNVAVAEELKVNKDTAANYRAFYEERIQAQAAANPGFTSDVLQNTLKVLEELDQVRSDAWQQIHRDRKIRIECPSCEHVFTFKVALTDQTRAQYHNVILKAVDSRAKVFGILGVKQEMFAQIQNVQYVQTKIIEYLTKNLPAVHREELADWMERELSEYLGSGGSVIDLPSVELSPAPTS